ncbi:MAG: sialidase family protein [Acidimicrobiales bacterium]|nr:glycoside hydrolase [Chloroflexota bacterium]
MVVAVAAVLLGLALVSDALTVGEAPRRVELGPEAPATPIDMKVTASNNSPLVVADPADARFVVLAHRLDAPDFGCALQISGDGGRSWIGANPVPQLPSGADKCYAPEVAFDRAGTLHYLFVGLHGDGNEPMGVFLVMSSDQARTFSPPRQVLGPLNFSVRMAIDRGTDRMHLVWLQAGADPALGGFAAVPNPILAAYSDDRGATFSKPVQVSDPRRPRVVAPALALGSDGAVHVAYYDLKEDARDYQGLEGPVWEGTWAVALASSQDDGKTFGRGRVIEDEVTPPERPMLIFTMAPPALAVGGNQVCAAWTDGRHGDDDVLARCSNNRGRRFGALRRLNDDRVGNGARQYLPRLSVAPDGRIDAVFLDRRLDPNNAFNDTFYTFSSDGGRHFSKSHHLSGARSWSRIGAEYVGPAAQGQYEIGGRLGLLSRRAGVVAAWPDSRNSYPGTQQELMTREVSLPAPTQPGWARVVGGVLVALGLLLGAMTVRGWRRGKRAAAQREATGAARPTGRRWARVVLFGVVVLAAFAALLARIDEKPSRTPAAVAPAPEVVDVTLSEYRLSHRAPQKGGRTVFRVQNFGQLGHAPVLLPLPDDLPPIDEQLHGARRRQLLSLAELALSKPGETQTFAVELVRGRRYAFVCFLNTGPERKVHALLGMNTEFRVGGPDAPAAPPLESVRSRTRALAV